MAEDETPRSSATRPLYVVSGGFLTSPRLKRILHLAGWSVRPGIAGAGDWVGVWGQTPVSARGRRVAHHTGAHLLTVEDAWLRSLFPGRAGEPPLGLLIDKTGVHFDPGQPSDLETLLATHPLDDPALLTRAEALIGQLRRDHLTKYAAVDPTLSPPARDYVLVIDQTRDDASVLASGGTPDSFARMLDAARDEHPGATILVKSHPETRAGFRQGYFDPNQSGVLVEDRPLSPWTLLDNARAVYTHSSTMGLEAILAGHRPVTFGQPFYTGWGLTDDRTLPPDRRNRALTAAQLCAGAILLYPTWYDPYRDSLTRAEETALGLAARARAWREDRRGYIAYGMRLWKRPHLQKAFGHVTPLRFTTKLPDPGTADRPVMAWASRTPPGTPGIIRVEDGLIRSNGLGAELTPPLSLCTDDLGIYYDPTRESRLDRLIAASTTLDPTALARSTAVIAALTGRGLSKYNTGQTALPALPEGRKILVPGQVEDDASVLLGCGPIRTNDALLAQTRSRNPDAILIYKPHPDVRAGLRKGALPASAERHADVILGDTSAAAALGAVDAVWTLTSTLGFEALLRGLPVTCLGLPFYAGWGLTTDHMTAPPWRSARPDLAGLVHAALIDYPRYTDPVTGLPCPVEVAIERLATGQAAPTGRRHRMLAKLQGIKATLGLRWLR